MNKELEEYYQARFSMFSEIGWKQLIEDVELMIVNTNTLDGIDDEKKLHFRKGELSILNWLKNLENVSNNAYQELKNEE
jgi:hypothetical protein